MTAKILRFPVERTQVIHLSKEELIPGLVYYRYDDPHQSHIEAINAYSSGKLTRGMVSWVFKEIEKRIASTVKRDREARKW